MSILKKHKFNHNFIQMRKVLLLYIITNTILLKAQPIINFEKSIINFDTISYAEDGTFLFRFTNTGNEPLIISNAQTNCGCFAVTFFPLEPILPGKSSVVIAKYDTKRIGSTTKNLTVTSNSINNPSYVLTIKGTIKREPTNNDIGFLKFGVSKIYNFGKIVLEDSIRNIIGGDKEVKPNQIKDKDGYVKIKNTIIPITDTGFYKKQIGIISSKINYWDFKNIEIGGLDTLNYTLSYFVFKSTIGDLNKNNTLSSPSPVKLANEGNQSIEIIDVKAVMRYAPRKYSEIEIKYSLSTKIIPSKETFILTFDKGSVFQSQKITSSSYNSNPNSNILFLVVKYKRTNSKIIENHYLSI